MEKIDTRNLHAAYLSKATYGTTIMGQAARFEDLRVVAEKINELIEALSPIN